MTGLLALNSAMEFLDRIIRHSSIDDQELHNFRHDACFNREVDCAESHVCFPRKSYYRIRIFRDFGWTDLHSFAGTFENDIGRASDIDQYPCDIDIMDFQLDNKEIVERFDRISRFSLLEGDDITVCLIRHIVSQTFGVFELKNLTPPPSF